MPRWITARESEAFRKQLANELPLTIKPAANFLPPMGGNIVRDDDAPTLAGKVASSIYDELIKRPNPVKVEAKKVLEQGKANLINFPNVVATHAPRLSFEVKRAAGKTGFHFGEYPNASGGHSFYFNTSYAQRKSPHELEIRGYIALKPEHTHRIPELFVRICRRLRDAGVDFNAKAASPNGANTRLDNMVFYIPQSHQAKARDVMKSFLEEEKVGEGTTKKSAIRCNLPGSAPGLSWAVEPSEEEHAIAREISGFTSPVSHNFLAAISIMPHYLERIAKEHEKKGNHSEAKTFRDEAKRVERILAR